MFGWSAKGKSGAWSGKFANFVGIVQWKDTFSPHVLCGFVFLVDLCVDVLGMRTDYQNSNTTHVIFVVFS
jgi:hypothetical protein